MRISNMADYAVVTMSAAARHCGASQGSARQVNAGQLASETGLPVPTVAKLVSRLAAAGLLRSTRGIGGGLRLARPPAAITLADIIEAVEGPIAMTSCGNSGPHACTLESACALRPQWPQVNRAVRGALAQVSLTQLTHPVTMEQAS